MIIAIDGPAGAGKSTVAKILAKKLGFLYIDTGALYRALTLKALEEAVNIQNARLLTDLARNTSVDLKITPKGTLKVLLDGKDVHTQIRQPRITRHVSDVAKVKGVRKVMLQLQRKLGSRRNSVLEGRDIGTVVFPRAQKKFFIDAHFHERVKRRFKDMKDLKVRAISLQDVAGDLKNRDTIDSTRKVAPLKKAKDAIYIDTTNLTIGQVVQEMLRHIKK